MRLDRAHICLDCDELRDGPGPCRACGALYTWPIAGWINRPKVLNMPPPYEEADHAK